MKKKRNYLYTILFFVLVITITCTYLKTSKTEGCSIEEQMMCFPLFEFAERKPFMARLLDSVADEVKYRFLLLTFIMEASISLTSVMILSACTPSTYSAEGFPKVLRVISSIVSHTVSRGFVVAALSK